MLGGFKFTGYQLAYLADTSPRVVVNKSRRIGFSEVACFKRACRFAGVSIIPGQPIRTFPPVPQNIFSASKPQAIALLERVVRWVRVLELMFGGRLSIIPSEDAGREIVRGRRGISMQAFSTNSRTSRGGEGDALLDEFANVMRQEEVWKAVKPLADRTLKSPRGYQIDVISTPLGDDNLFYRFCEDPRFADQWSRHTVDINRAIAEGFAVTNDDGQPVTADDLRRETVDESLFAQEYLCSFMASSQRYIDRETWEAACYGADTDQPEGRGSGIFGGMDIGAGGHESVIVDLERNGDTLWQLAEADRRRERDWDAQERWVADGMKRRSRFAVDASGIGDQFGQRLEATFPGVAESVKFTLQSKEELATGLKLALARKKLRPMADDTRLMRDVLSLRRTITAVGNVRYDADETKHAHADGAWALALAVYAAGGATREPYKGAKAKVREPSGIAGPRHKRGDVLR